MRKWNPKTQELLNGITKKEALGKQHYIATLDEKGLVNNVDYLIKMVKFYGLLSCTGMKMVNPHNMILNFTMKEIYFN